MAGTFQSLMANVDAVLNGFYGTAGAAMSHWIMPLAWMVLGISILVWSLLIMTGRIAVDIGQFLLSGLFIIIVLYLASGGYKAHVADPLYHLPDQLASALSNGTDPATILDDLFSKMLDLCAGIAKAVSDQAKSLNFGGALILLLILGVVVIVCGLLLVGAMYVLLYAKLGLSLVLAVGPFFIIWLAWQSTRAQFYPWLNTSLYLAFLYVLTHLFINLFIKIVDAFMQKLLTAIGSQSPATIAAVLMGQVNTNVNILVAALQLGAIALPFFFLLLQLPAIAQSMTSASAGSFGHGMTNVAGIARRALTRSLTN